MVTINDPVIVIKTGPDTGMNEDFLDENAKVIDINLGKVQLLFNDGLKFWTDTENVMVNPDGFL